MTLSQTRFIELFLSHGLIYSRRIEIVKQLTHDDWATISGWARQSGTLSNVYAFLHEEGICDLIPKDLAGEFRYEYLSIAARNIFFLDRAATLLSGLKAKHVRVVALKGIFLLDNIYHSIGERSMNDIDLLVPRNDLACALRFFNEKGFSPKSYFDIKAENIDIKHVPPLMKPDEPIVELHWTLLEEDEPFRIEMENVWERVRPVMVNNVEVFALGVEDAILHLCLHSSYQHYFQNRLRGLIDIDKFIWHSSPDIDWDNLMKIASEWRAERVVWLTFALLIDLFHTPISSDFQVALAKAFGNDRVLQSSRAMLLSQEASATVLTPDLARLDPNSSLLEKIKVGLSRIFISKTSLSRLYNVPPNSMFINLYYFRRLWDLVKNYAITAIKVLFKSKKIQGDIRNQKSVNQIHAWLGGEEWNE